MKDEYTENIEEIITYNHDLIDASETVEVNLKDLMYVYCTLQEYVRFFHQPEHYKTLEDVNHFLGSVKENGGYKILSESVYQKMREMMPRHIEEKFDEGDFDSPKFPWYYEVKM
jgi:hypothetical protein